jgi:guanylate kinase
MAQADRKKGRVFVLSAPSGTGKGTVIKKLLRSEPELRLSVSCTTRPRRKGEREGKHYFFVPEKEFLRKIRKKELLEWARVYGNHYYGTPRRPVRETLASGRDVLLELDVRGAAAVKKAIAGSILIFLLPPTPAELEKRLRGRGTDTEADVQRRIRRAKQEIRQAKQYDYLVINDSLKQAVQDFRCILRSRRLSLADGNDVLKRFLGSTKRRGIKGRKS